MRILTNDYVNAHRTEPRGYGDWAFWFGEKKSLGNFFDHIYFFPGMYTPAKKQAMALAKKMGYSTIHVLG